jgi:hypothetical protein
MYIEELRMQVVYTIQSAWKEDAFHLVFHSSGYDSRIISSAIKHLLMKHGSEWLGKGLLFLSNRWEADGFRKIMAAQGWDKSQYLVYDEGRDDEHFANAVYNLSRCAPCPIPGNLWHYLPGYAIRKGAMPARDIQAFTGLWANEAWDCFLQTPNPWEKRISKHYGHHVMASLPVMANWVEHPLVDNNILNNLRYIDYKDGKKLRKDLANYMCPEAQNIKREGLHDRKHPISKRLRNELDSYYTSTYWGQKVPWHVPKDSELSTEWGKLSMALLVEDLRLWGKNIK